MTCFSPKEEIFMLLNAKLKRYVVIEIFRKYCIVTVLIVPLNSLCRRDLFKAYFKPYCIPLLQYLLLYSLPLCIDSVNISLGSRLQYLTMLLASASYYSLLHNALHMFCSVQRYVMLKKAVSCISILLFKFSYLSQFYYFYNFIIFLSLHVFFIRNFLTHKLCKRFRNNY